jgi:hypothetical protein
LENSRNIKCSVCGLSADDDKNFHKKAKLCNRHWLQIKRNDKPTDTKMTIPNTFSKLTNCCSVCGDTESVKYYIWRQDGEFYNKELCNKHYTQLIKHGYLLDTEKSSHQKRHKWTKEEDNELEELYKQGLSFEDICEKMNMSMGMISSRSTYLKLGDKYMRINNPKFKAVYQDYDWCYQRYVIRGMSHQEMADECGASLRVIKKWCSDIHKLNKRTFKENKEMTDLQWQIILFGTLGDGHIDKRETQPIYIESHAEDEKDYAYWKYDQLKDLCNSPPKYYKEVYRDFGTENQYLCQPYYRFETRIINQLKEIRSMSRIEKINYLNEFGLCLHILDDGSRGNTWELCLAEYTKEEIELYINLCESRFCLNCWQKKDERYITFDAISSRKIDQIILKNLPNDLDIIKKKILNNSNITNAAQYVFVISNDNQKIGLNTYCRTHKIPYMKAKKITTENDLVEIKESVLLDLIQNEEMQYAI